MVFRILQKKKLSNKNPIRHVLDVDNTIEYNKRWIWNLYAQKDLRHYPMQKKKNKVAVSRYKLSRKILLQHFHGQELGSAGKMWIGEQQPICTPGRKLNYSNGKVHTTLPQAMILQGSSWGKPYWAQRPSQYAKA